MRKTKSMFRLLEIGSKDTPRYVILDNRRRSETPFYWTGKEGDFWSSNPREARLWQDHETLALDLQQIVRVLMREKPIRTFSLQIDITLIGNLDISQSDLQGYLDKALEMRLDYCSQGMGPAKGSAVLMNINTDALKEVVE